MTYEELREAYDRLLLENERLKRIADDAREKLDAAMDGTGLCIWQNHVPTGKLIIFNRRWGSMLGYQPKELSAHFDIWRDGAEAYKGISVNGFPNLFLLYGPNTNLGHNSILYMLESQFAYVLNCLDALQQQGLRYMDVKPQVQQRFNQHLQQVIRHSIWEQGCTSWYKNAAGKNTNNWPGFTFTYRQQTRHLELADYDCSR